MNPLCMSIHARTRLVKVPDGHIGRSQFQRRVNQQIAVFWGEIAATHSKPVRF